jgi:two-component system nitrogen regulation response regulator GlnG/two-component system response regulator HydG
MLAPGSTTLEAPDSISRHDGEVPPALALVVVACESAPERLGEVLLPGVEPGWFGRETEDDAEPRWRLLRQRPEKNERTAPLDNPFLSRRHLKIACTGDHTLTVQCQGRAPLRVDRTELEELTVHPGDVFELKGLFTFLCVERPQRLDLAPAHHDHAFGYADEHGIVGESPAAWALRAQTAFAAGRGAHVLITGPSGTGKELVARAIHAGSSRARKPLVARNAATFPTGLIDAELFGNLANYPNAGMPERPGLVGQADGSTLFLDEIGELPIELQARLLRLLDSGEYQRLGDARARVADFRLVAATNRAVTELKEDVAARLALRVHLPGLNERAEDIPLLARHLLQRIAARDAPVGERYLRNWDGHTGEPRISPTLVSGLIRHQYSTHVRELERLLWRSIQSSSAGTLELTSDVRAQLREPPARRAATEITSEELRAALARHGGLKDRVWRELGLSSRHALLRLMKRLGEG